LLNLRLPLRYLKATERCDFVCYLGWERHAVFCGRWPRLWLSSDLPRDISLCCDYKEEVLIFSSQSTQLKFSWLFQR